MWTKDLPKLAGYYWVVLKDEQGGLPCIAPMIVGNIGEGNTVLMGCMLSGSDEPVPLKKAEGRVMYWYGPVLAPELPENIKSEVGELEEVA